MYKVEITGVDTSKLKTLSSKETVSLLQEIKDGNLSSRDKLIKGNLKLVLSVIKKFHQRKHFWNSYTGNI